MGSETLFSSCLGEDHLSTKKSSKSEEKPRNGSRKGHVEGKSQSELNTKTLYLESLARFKELKRLGYKLHGDCGSDSTVKPEWFNPKLFEEGRMVGQKNFFACFFGHLCGVYVLVQVPSIAGPLLSTGNSRSLSDLFGRYLSTLNHVRAWYYGDVWNPEDDAFKSINVVRKTHKLVSKRLNADRKETVDQVALSQFDMFLTLWAFLGNSFLHPKETGFPSDPHKMKAYFHFWRTIGYLMGVRDEYNVCDDDDMERTAAMMQVVWDQEFEPLLLKNIQAYGQAPTEYVMAESIVESLRPLLPILSTAGFVKYYHEMYGIKTPVTLDKMGDKMSHNLMKVTMSSLLPSMMGDAVGRLVLNRAIVRCNNDLKKIQKDLTGKGPIHEPYEEPITDGTPKTRVNTDTEATMLTDREQTQL